MTSKKTQKVSRSQVRPWLENRRRARVLTEDGAHVLISSATRRPEPVVVEDVSFGGIALRTPKDLSLAVGDKVQIDQDAGSFSAVVQYTLEEEDGTYRIGCMWTDPASPGTRTLVRGYMEQ
jgi:hypothetical protein